MDMYRASMRGFVACLVLYMLQIHHQGRAKTVIDDLQTPHAHSLGVACCRLFADRRWLDGAGSAQPVVSYQELIAHLCQKSSASTAYLMFEGMNQVVYRHSVK